MTQTHNTTQQCVSISHQGRTDAVGDILMRSRHQFKLFKIFITKEKKFSSSFKITMCATDTHSMQRIMGNCSAPCVLRMQCLKESFVGITSLRCCDCGLMKTHASAAVSLHGAQQHTPQAPVRWTQLVPRQRQGQTSGFLKRRKQGDSE